MTARKSFKQQLQRQAKPRRKTMADDVLWQGGINSATIIKRARSDTASLSTADIVDLREKIGNHAVQRLLNPPSSETRKELLRSPDSSPLKRKPRRQSVNTSEGVPGSAGPESDARQARRSSLVQRDVTGDIAVDSPEFWTHMRSRTYSRLLGWIGDSRQKLNEFVAIMGDTDSPSPWGSVALSWVQVLGTAGDVVSAMTATLQAIKPDLDSPATLFEFRNKMERNLDLLSAQVNNLSSDLPIYALLRKLESAGAATTDEARATTRTQPRQELEHALANLPSPTRLKQALAASWMSSAGRGRSDTTIQYQTSYTVIPSTALDTGKVDTSQLRSVLVREDGSDYFVGERKDNDKPILTQVQRPEQTIKALRNAFDASTPVQNLPANMIVRIWIYGSGQSGPLGGTPSLLWKRDAATRIWAPVKGLGSDMDDAVFGNWVRNGYKPTLAELE